MRITPDGAQSWTWANIVELAGQEVTGADNGMSFLEANMLSQLTAPGGASTTDELAGVLFQISMLPAIRTNKASTNTVRAVAFILAEGSLDGRPETIAEAVSSRMDSQMGTLKEELNAFAADVEARAAATAANLKLQVEAVARSTVETIKQATQGINDSTNKLTETTTRYRNTLTRPPPGDSGMEPRFSQLGPRLRAREGVRS